MQRFIAELKRRHVPQVTGVYLVAAWGLSTGSVDIFAVMGLPPAASRYFVFALFLCTPLVMVISWLFEFDRSGIYRDHGPFPEIRDATVMDPHSDAPGLKVLFEDKTRTLNHDFTVGRDDACEFQINDPRVSRQHTRFECIDGRWRAQDLGSSNGTTIDGRKVDTAWLDGDASVSFYTGCPSFEVSVKADTRANTIIVDDGSS